MEVPKTSPPARPPLSVVAFGTSLTARGGWPDALRSQLSACLRREVSLATVAMPGATSDWALAHVADVVRRHPDVVIVEFAANDAALTRWISLSASRANMEGVFAALDEARPRPRVLLLAMNPVHGLRGWLRPRLSAFTQAHAGVALGSGAEFADLAPRWRALGPERLARAIPDGLHPEPEAAIAVIVPDLVRRLSNGSCPG